MLNGEEPGGRFISRSWGAGMGAVISLLEQVCGGGHGKVQIVCTLDFRTVLGQVILWVLLIIITIGIAAPFFAYFFVRMIINHTEIHQVASENA